MEESHETRMGVPHMGQPVGQRPGRSDASGAVVPGISGSQGRPQRAGHRP